MIYIEVNLSNIEKNAKTIISTVKTELIAVVKANAYGLGYKKIVSILSDITNNFAVANAYESSQILRILPNAKVLVLSNERYQNYDKRSVFAVSNDNDLDFLADKAKFVAIKVNTGMNRFGCSPTALDGLVAKAKFKGLVINEIFTHFYSLESAQEQFDLFNKATAPYKNAIKLHCCASNCLNLPKQYYLDGVRCGLALYGFGHNLLLSAVEIYTKIVNINFVKRGDNIGYGRYVAKRDMVVAVLSAGYADGISLSPELRFSINGNICKVVNRPCMDTVAVDVTGIACKVGDRAYILGESISMERAQIYNQAISYQILTAFHTRAIYNYVKR